MFRKGIKFDIKVIDLDKFGRLKLSAKQVRPLEKKQGKLKTSESLPNIRPGHEMVQRVAVKIKKLAHFDEALSLPRYETLGSAGADIRACLPDQQTSLILGPSERVLIPTGLAMEIPLGFEIQVRPRSGLALKTPLFLCNSPGTIDSDYRGEVKILMGNLSARPYAVRHGERIAQILLAPITQAVFELTDELNPTERGTGGFGSTGIK